MNIYKIGDIIECLVTGIQSYGIFVKVDENYLGLIHISEISDYYVKKVEDYAQVGEKIYCKVLEIDEQNKKLKLSIKNINYKYHNIGIYEKETRSGFSPLKSRLDNWINEKLSEYNYKEK